MGINLQKGTVLLRMKLGRKGGFNHSGVSMCFANFRHLDMPELKGALNSNVVSE